MRLGTKRFDNVSVKLNLKTFIAGSFALLILSLLLPLKEPLFKKQYATVEEKNGHATKLGGNQLREIRVQAIVEKHSDRGNKKVKRDESPAVSAAKTQYRTDTGE